MPVSEQCRTCGAPIEIPDSRIGDGKPILCSACGKNIFVRPSPPIRGHLGEHDDKPAPPSAESSSVAPQLGAPTFDYPQAIPHSGLGVGSFLVAVLIGGLDVIMILIAFAGIARERDAREIPIAIAAGGLGFFCFNMLSVPICLVGAGMGAVAVFTQRDRKHLLSWIGLAFNLLVVVSIVGLLLVGATNSARR